MKRKLIKYHKLLLLSGVVLFISFLNLFPPDNILSVFLFYILLSSILTGSLSIFIKPPLSIIFSASTILLLFLRQIKQFNLLNILIIFSINILLYFYFRNHKRN